jgi:hypothetical protein
LLQSVGLPNFMRAKSIVGIAWDVKKGALLVAVDDSVLTPLFREGVQPGPAVGAGLFPVLSGRAGCRVAYNLGQRKFKKELPTGFRPCSDALKQVS